MLVQMTERGPDSAGVAVYADGLRMPAASTRVEPRSSRRGRAVAGAGCGDGDGATRAGRVLIRSGRAQVGAGSPRPQVVSSGRDLEVFKGVGLPVDISNEYGVPARHGYLGVGHTRWRRSRR